MIAGIITIPSREREVKNLCELILPSVDKLEIFVDDKMQGHWFNYARCMTTMLNQAKKNEPVLIMTDEVVTVKDWRERWEKIHAKAGDNIYVLFARQKHLFKPENINRGYITKLQLRGFYDQATIFINHNDLMDKALYWFHNEGGKEHPRVSYRTSHLDVVVQEYLLTHNIPWTITVPTLFDHLPIKSSLGHNIGGSPLYVGSIN